MFSFTSLKNSKLWRERRAVGSFLLFCVIYFGISTVIFWIFCFGPLYRVVRSRSWIACPAVVIECGKTWEHNGRYSGYILHMRYEYLWQNQKMEGDRYDFFLSRFSGINKSVHQIVKSFPPGKRIECLVNPENPSETVVTRSIPWMAWLGILVPLILILAGIYLAQSAVRGFFKKKQPLAENTQKTEDQS